MHKIFSRLRNFLRFPEMEAACDRLAKMSLRDLADLPSQHRLERPACPQPSSPPGQQRCPG